MPEDVPLDEFGSSETEADAESEVDAEADTETEADTEPDTETEAESDTEPAISTFAWSPDGGECAVCGVSAERRWRSDGQKDGELVCADCKEW